MLKPAAQKDNPAKPFFLLQLQRHINLILLRLHMPKHQRIPVSLRLLLNDLNHVAEKGIGNSLHQNGNTFCIRSL